VTIKLSKTELEVGKLYFEQGLKPQEIAKRLNISINTVYKAISKYRNYLKETSKQSQPQIQTEQTTVPKTEENTRSETSQIGKDSKPESVISGDGASEIAVDTKQVLEQDRARTSVELKRENEIRKVTICGMINLFLELKVKVPLLPEVTLLSVPRETSFEKSLPVEHGKVYADGNGEAFLKICDFLQQLVQEIRELKQSLVKVLEEAHVRCAASSASSGQEEALETKTEKKSKNQDDVPEFLRDNVWVDIIRSKYNA